MAPRNLLRNVINVYTGVAITSSSQLVMNDRFSYPRQALVSVCRLTEADAVGHNAIQTA
jgi:hypothetical protein